MLVDHIDMCAHDAMDFVKLIRSHSGLKKYSKFISGKVSKYCRVIFFQGDNF